MKLRRVSIQSWRCPNDPPCEHGVMLHDMWTVEDPQWTCCVESCDCGRDHPEVVRRREARQRARQVEQGREAAG
jgi:hypothetical protein